MTDLASHLSMPKYCPSCGKNYFKRIADKVTFSEVTWADGLGSPGTMTYRTPRFQCNYCKTVTGAIYNG